MLVDLFLLISALVMVIIGVFVFVKNKNNFAFLNFSLFLFSIATWVTANVFIDRTENYETVVLLGKITGIAISLAPVLFLSFIAHFPRTKLKEGKKLLLVYLPTVFFFIVSFTDYIVSGADLNVYPVAIEHGFLYPYFSLYVFAYFTAALVLTIWRFLKSKGLQRSQIAYILFGAFLMISISFVTNLILPLFKISTSFTRIGPSSTLIFTLFTTYAILKHRLFDVQIQLQNFFNYLIPFIFVLPLTLVLGIFLYDSGSNPYLVGSFILVSGSLLYKFLFDKISNASFGHFFFRRTYRYQNALKELAKDASTILDIEKLADKIIKVLHETVGINKVVVITNVSGAKSYQILKECCKLGKDEREKFMKLPLILLTYMQKSNEPIVREEIKLSLEYAKGSKTKELLEVYEEINKLDMDLCLPLMLQESLIGVIFLGSKEKKKAYTAEDIEIFKDLARELSIAIANSNLHQSKSEQAQLLQKEVQKQTKEIKDLYEMKSNFLTVASHQLRTPTSIIRGMLSILIEDDLPQDKMKEMITSAFKSSSNLERVIEDILTAAEIDSAKFGFDPEAVDIIPIISEVLDDLELKAEKKKLNLSFKKPNFEKALVLTSPTKIEQVFVNLVDNALNYTTKGDVTVTVKKEKIDKSDCYVFSCQDTGVGMTKEDISKIGEKFFRSKNVFSVHPNGTGLGIYIVNSIVNSSGGKFWVESEGLGKGSTFNVALKIAKNK